MADADSSHDAVESSRLDRPGWGILAAIVTLEAAMLFALEQYTGTKKAAFGDARTELLGGAHFLFLAILFLGSHRWRPRSVLFRGLIRFFNWYLWPKSRYNVTLVGLVCAVISSILLTLGLVHLLFA